MRTPRQRGLCSGSRKRGITALDAIAAYSSAKCINGLRDILERRLFLLSRNSDTSTDRFELDALGDKTCLV